MLLMFHLICDDGNIFQLALIAFEVLASTKILLPIVETISLNDLKSIICELIFQI